MPDRTALSDLQHKLVAAQAEIERLRERTARLESQLAFECQLELDSDEQARRVEDFARSSSGWFWEMDENFRFVYFSRSVESITGIPPEWHYGKSREDIGIPEAVTAEAWRDHLETLRRHEPFRDFVYLRRGPDGAQWMQSSGIPVFDDDGRFRGYRGSGADVTERIEAQHRATLLGAAIENLSDLFVLWDADDALVVCNARFREINAPVVHTTQPGTRFEDHIRAALDAGLYPQAEGREQAWFAERLARHRNPKEPFELERQDGRWILIAEHRLPDGCTATISTDITERKRAELELSRHRDSLERMVLERTAHLRSANEEIKRFTYMVSHDLRAPLVSISGFTSELDRDCREALRLLEQSRLRLEPDARAELMRLLDSSVPEALTFIQAAASRMDRQIAALLEYSRLGARELVPRRLDLAAIVSGCLDSMAHQIERSGVEVDVAELPPLVCDAVALEQILGNLLDNAIKYLDPQRRGRIEIRGDAQRSTVHIEIRDNGRGIAERDRERVFRAFVRAAPAEITGVGMGLAEVEALVRRLGGRVWCESELNRGTAFHVELPAMPAAEDAAALGAVDAVADFGSAG